MKTMTILAALAMVTPLAAQQDPAKAEALRKLNTMKVSVDFESMKLSQAIDYLREATGLNFVLKPAAAEADGPVRLKVKDLAVRSVLKLLLSSRGLAASWKDGALVIGPQEDVQEAAYTLRMYDVRDTIVKIQDFPGPVIELVTPGSGPSMAGITVFQLDEPRQPIPPDFIVEMIRDNTGGRSWDSPKAAVSHVNGMLVVSQTAAVHREIAQLLSKLGQYR